MSTSRYLNWSRPSPGRHPLRKQMSCIESFSSGRSLSVNNLASVSTEDKRADFATFVTAAIIHTNRFQNYHTYHQARRGTIISGSGSDGSGTPTLSSGPPTATLRRRPASAQTSSASSSSSAAGSSSSSLSFAMAKKANANETRKVLTKQLSLDHPTAATAMGPAAGHAWTTTANRAPSICDSGASDLGSQLNPKACGISGIKKRPPGICVKNDPEPNEHTKKALKQAKDARINIKIFLGQTIQQDSSDTGISDTECSVIQREPNQASLHQNNQHHPSNLPPQQQQQQQGNHRAEAEYSQPDGESKAKPSQPSNGGPAAGGASTSSSTSGGGGRNSSLAQRRAQFHASRQNSEAAERRPPLVRAMSAPIRPIDDTSKFLQSKKKTRKKKVLRERDEINECDEDEFDEDSIKLNTANNKNSLAGPRSRSVIGGACDIETLVSLLSSGGSDSEKEDSVPVDLDSTSASSNIIGSVLKSRAPMLKKAGKSVSFQEAELKQSAGLNRDYYTPGHRKPPLLQPFANRIRRSQQLANSLTAFQRKEIKKSSSEESKSDDDKEQPNTDDGSREKTKKESTSPPIVPKTAPDTASGQDLVDGQTPKERECYRLFQKMSTMGLSVSYDTILRGMLTPTELRVLQKQRTKLQKQQESRQNSSETETNDSSDNSKSDRTSLTCSISSGKDVQVANGLVFDKPAVVEQ